MRNENPFIPVLNTRDQIKILELMWWRQLDHISDSGIDHIEQLPQHFVVRLPIQCQVWIAWKRRAQRTTGKHKQMNFSYRDHFKMTRIFETKIKSDVICFYLRKIFKFANRIWIRNKRQTSSTFDYFRYIVDLHIMCQIAQNSKNCNSSN